MHCNEKQSYLYGKIFNRSPGLVYYYVSLKEVFIGIRFLIEGGLIRKNLTK